MTVDVKLYRMAKSLYDKHKREQVGQADPEAVERDAISWGEKVMPGFRQELAERAAEAQRRMEDVRLMPVLHKDGGRRRWFRGPGEDGVWARYRDQLESKGFPADGIQGIDDSTNSILGRSAGPLFEGDKRKGLVIGYVQSGKTANYAGLIAKAVDEGYRIIIVLAGMHSNLRTQTQSRLAKDLGFESSSNDPDSQLVWITLTDDYQDVGARINSGYVHNRANTTVIVTKKHEKRLSNVRKFLESIPPNTLRQRPVMVIDDESDQASPNSLGGKNLISTINLRVRDIWKAIETGTYIAYTATPFANLFIDPNDPEDLYPEDFAALLPKPKSYLGADRFFATSDTVEDERDELLVDLARSIPPEDSKLLAPKGRDLTGYEPQVTGTLKAALHWFLIASAIRRSRTEVPFHASMLIHTSHRVEAHRRLRDAVAQYLGDMVLDLETVEGSAALERSLRGVFELEARSSLCGSGQWSAVWEDLKQVIASATVKMDNGRSDDRLAYGDPAEHPQTVIAVGGGTLSRGLTLEGLTVSYFLRTSTTYDTLLQMGRWFGFRPGYEDLVRVWAAPGMLNDYAHLARVESQLRDEIEQMAREEKTPRQMAIRILKDPGRLEITAKGKMAATSIVQAGLGGSRRQTIYLDTSDQGVIEGQKAARELVRAVIDRGAEILRPDSRGSVLIPGVTHDELLTFLDAYWIAPMERFMQPDAMRTWLARHGEGKDWNLVLIGGPRTSSGEFEYAEGVTVRTVSRAPLTRKNWSQDYNDEKMPKGADIRNIRALLSAKDHLADLRILGRQNRYDPVQAAVLKSATEKLSMDEIPRGYTAERALRAEISPDSGLILLYAIDAKSRQKDGSSTREAMNANGHIVGLGLVYPSTENEDPNEYVAVSVDETFADDDQDETLVDDERDHPGPKG